MTPAARFVGLGLVAGAALVLQVALTRVFSLLIWYHFAFLAVALALLGFTSGGMLVQARPSLCGDAGARARLSLYFAASIPAALLLMTRLPFGSSILESPGQMALFALLLVSLLVPFTLAGVVVASTLSSLRGAIHRAYLADLVGSGLGCGLSIWAMDTLGGGPGGVLVASATAACGAVCFSLEGGAKGSIWARSALLLALLGAGILIVRAPTHSSLFLPNAKLYPRIPREFIVHRECSSVACVDFFRNPLHFGLWGVAKDYQGPKPEQIGVVIDAWAVTSILQGKRDGEGKLIAPHPVFEALPPSLVYQQKRAAERPPGEVLVIGSGGGLDVRSALHFGAGHVDAVEINPTIIKATKGAFNQFSGGIYRHPQVSLHNAEGRHFLRSQGKRYDVIQISGVDTFAASQAGAFALSENYLYTTEALREFVDHLSDEGTLSFTRWLYKPPRQTLRLVATADEALRSMGLGGGDKNLMVVAAPVYDSEIDFSVILVKRRPFTEREVEAVREVARVNSFSVIYAPHGPLEDTAFRRYFEAKDRKKFIDEYPFQISPCTDDKPFFFEHARFSRLLESRDTIFGAASGQLVLLSTLALVLLASGLFLGVPALLARRQSVSMAPSSQAMFLLLGLGYLGVELVFVPRFSLFLGNPSHALSVVLLSMLICSGVGASLSPRLLARGPRAVAAAVGALVLVLLAYQVALPSIFGVALAWPFAARVLLSTALVALPALLMGVPFPAAIARDEAQGEAWVARAWVLNGYASVVASVGATLLAMVGGFSSVLLAGALCYAAVAALWWRREAQGAAA